MRQLTAIFLIGLTLCQVTQAQLGKSASAAEAPVQTALKSVAGCTLAVTPNQAVFIAGENVSLTATVHNNGPNIIYMPGTSPFLSYQISVREPDGTEAPKTLYYKGWLHEFIKERRPFTLRPEKTLTEVINLGRGFDMSQSGIYTVNITRVIGSPPDGREALLLPPVTLKIRLDEDDKSPWVIH